MSTPQPPYHRWRANEQTHVKPLSVLDYCLDCLVPRWDSMADWPGVSERRRRLAEERNARAVAPCPGPRGD